MSVGIGAHVDEILLGDARVVWLNGFGNGEVSLCECQALVLACCAGDAKGDSADELQALMSRVIRQSVPFRQTRV